MNHRSDFANSFRSSTGWISELRLFTTKLSKNIYYSPSLMRTAICSSWDSSFYPLFDSSQQPTANILKLYLSLSYLYMPQYVTMSQAPVSAENNLLFTWNFSSCFS